MNQPEFFEAVKAGDLPRVSAILSEDRNRLLADRGADVNLADARFGATPAGWAIEYLRELGGLLAIEIDDLLFAIQQRDATWVARLLERFPRLKDATDAQGTPLKAHAEQCGNEDIAAMFAG